MIVADRLSGFQLSGNQVIPIIEELLYQYIDKILIILGGLIKNVEGKATIIGIISWGISKCPVGRPGIYTNVAKFSNWIEKIMRDTSTNGTTDTATTTDAATTGTTTTTTQTTSSINSPSNTITTDRTTISSSSDVVSTFFLAKSMMSKYYVNVAFYATSHSIVNSLFFYRYVITFFFGY